MRPIIAKRRKVEEMCDFQSLLGCDSDGVLYRPRGENLLSIPFGMRRNRSWRQITATGHVNFQSLLGCDALVVDRATPGAKAFNPFWDATKYVRARVTELLNFQSLLGCDALVVDRATPGAKAFNPFWDATIDYPLIFEPRYVIAFNPFWDATKYVRARVTELLNFQSLLGCDYYTAGSTFTKAPYLSIPFGMRHL